MRELLIRTGPAVALICAIMMPQPAQSQSAVADFFRNRTVSVAFGAGPVGGYASYARLAVDHMARHVPGKPSFVFQSMPGGGGLVAANYAFNAAPKDGTFLLLIVQTAAVDQAMKSGVVRFDARKFNYIGRFTDNTALAVGWQAAGINSVDDLRKRTVVTGGTGPSSPTDIIPKLLNRYAGTKYKLVSGYKGLGPIKLAMESGEVEAMVGSYTTFTTNFAHLVRDNKVKILVQLAPKRHPELKDVPTAGEIASSEEGRLVADFFASSAEIGKSLATTPGVPAARVQALRAAFTATLKDPLFLADARKRKLDMNPATAAELEAIVAATVATPADIAAKAAALVAGGGNGAGKGEKK